MILEGSNAKALYGVFVTSFVLFYRERSKAISYDCILDRSCRSGPD
jgi:hypothetical protein